MSTPALRERNILLSESSPSALHSFKPAGDVDARSLRKQPSLPSRDINACPHSLTEVSVLLFGDVDVMCHALYSPRPVCFKWLPWIIFLVFLERCGFLSTLTPFSLFSLWRCERQQYLVPCSPSRSLPWRKYGANVGMYSLPSLAC